MIVWEPLDFWLQNDQSMFVQIEVLHKIGAGTPDTVQVRINSCEDIEQMLDIYIFRSDPLRSSEVGLVGINID